MTKTVVITGANRGLGLALTQAYLAQGDVVIGGCRNPATAQALRAAGAELFPLDVSDFASIDAFAAALGDRRLDVLVNCAGVDARAFGADDSVRGALTISTEHFESVMRVNVTGPLLLVERLSGALRAARGTVVNISSQIGSFEVAQKIGRDVSYAASKTALNMVTLKQAQAMVSDGVIVIALHPGWLRTDMGGAAADLDPSDAAKQIVATIEGLTPAHNGSFLRWDGTVHPW
jgi:NAD(P)-dependent dehydrogenase (short-subunit alcohol dehydrogenase family)